MMRRQHDKGAGEQGKRAESERSMLRELLFGVCAGAVGTAALNIITYLDMVLRGRPSSNLPAKVAGAMGALIGIRASGAKAAPRQEGYGALLGYVVGLGLGLIYGLIRPALALNAGWLVLAGVILGIVAMLASDVPAIVLRQTKPATWGVTGWLSDIIPHLGYGLVTVYAYEAFLRL